MQYNYVINQITTKFSRRNHEKKRREETKKSYERNAGSGKPKDDEERLQIGKIWHIELITLLMDF